MILDTSALLAFFDDNEPAHARVSEIINATTDALVVSPYVVAELDYLLLTRHGPAAEHLALVELCSGAWELALMGRERMQAAAKIVARYHDVPIGITDASNIVLAEAYQTRDIATLDRRHFGILRFSNGAAPAILP